MGSVLDKGCAPNDGGGNEQSKQARDGFFATTEVDGFNDEAREMVKRVNGEDGRIGDGCSKVQVLLLLLKCGSYASMNSPE